MCWFNRLTLVQAHVSFNLNADSVMVRRECLERRPLQHGEVKLWQTWLSFNQPAHLEPFLLSNKKHFSRPVAFLCTFFCLETPQLFNDSRPCGSLWINYLSLYQWQRVAHWDGPCPVPIHTPAIHCKEKARVCVCVSHTYLNNKTGFIHILLSKTRIARPLN